MARHHQKLPKREVEKIFYYLCLAISQISDTKEAAEFLRDILSYQEAEMIAKRLKIAELLLKNHTYEEIRSILKVSPITIARVQEWLKLSGEGYRKIIARAKYNDHNDQKNKEVGTWRALKKKYPSYFWPEVILEEIIRSAGKRQRERMQKVIDEMGKMERKRDIYKKLQNILRKNNYSK